MTFETDSQCHGQIVAKESDRKVRATQFNDCLRRCEPCGIGASNAANLRDVTSIHRNPLGNIPVECREGANEALMAALNVRNRKSKLQRFGFSTSEDAVTWVVFTYLLRSGRLLGALLRGGFITEKAFKVAPTLLLWGVPINNYSRGADLRKNLSDLCTNFQENRNSFSEPDAIVDFGEEGLVFIEVKYRSPNEFKPADYRGWSRYATARRLDWNFSEVKLSGCYELARNWCLLKSLAVRRPANLVNLGPTSLFLGTNGAPLDRFVTALGTGECSQFVKMRWGDLLEDEMRNAPVWFSHFCQERALVECCNAPQK